MEKENIQQLVQNNYLLAETNSRLVKINENSVNMNKEQLAKHEQLITYIRQEFQALSDKKERNIQEESQYLFLRKLLIGR